MIPREIYTLGAVQLNTQPLAALQGQLLAKKAARDEAFNKWHLQHLLLHDPKVHQQL